MAFVRWRMNCAELLATVYRDGRSRQILLTNLPGPYVPMHLKNEVSRRYPDIPVDWNAVQQALARGPKEHPVLPITRPGPRPSGCSVNSLHLSPCLAAGPRTPLPSNRPLGCSPSGKPKTSPQKPPLNNPDMSSDDQKHPIPEGDLPP